MKNHLLFAASFLLIITSCKNNEQIKYLPQKKIAIEKSTASTPQFSKNDYDFLYQYVEGESKQVLGLSYIDKKTIKYYLQTVTLPWDTEFWGNAENKYSAYSSEVDEDENGTAYGANEFTRSEVDYSISIRIAIDSSRVIIHYTDSRDQGTDCVPITGQIMKRIK